MAFVPPVRRPSAIDVIETLYDAVTRRRRPRSIRLVAEQLAGLPGGASVLDLGAGGGRVALGVERATGLRVTACDVSPDVLRSGRRPSGGQVAGDGQALPFASGSFQAVYLVYVLHHVGDAARLLGEVARVLTDDGVLVVVDFDSRSRLATLFQAAARLTGRRCRFVTPDALRALLPVPRFRATTRQLDGATFVVVGRSVPQAINAPSGA